MHAALLCFITILPNQLTSINRYHNIHGHFFWIFQGMSAGSVASPPPRPPSGGSGGGGSGLRPPGAESPLDVLSRAAAAASAMVDDRSNGSDAAAAPSSSSSSSSAAPSSSSGGIAAAAEVNGQPKRTGTNFSPSLPFFYKSPENESTVCVILSLLFAW